MFWPNFYHFFYTAPIFNRCQLFHPCNFQKEFVNKTREWSPATLAIVSIPSLVLLKSLVSHNFQKGNPLSVASTEEFTSRAALINFAGRLSEGRSSFKADKRVSRTSKPVASMKIFSSSGSKSLSMRAPLCSPTQSTTSCISPLRPARYMMWVARGWNFCH